MYIFLKVSQNFIILISNIRKSSQVVENTLRVQKGKTTAWKWDLVRLSSAISGTAKTKPQREFLLLLEIHFMVLLGLADLYDHSFNVKWPQHNFMLYFPWVYPFYLNSGSVNSVESINTNYQNCVLFFLAINRLFINFGN